MKIEFCPIISQSFREKIGKTVIETPVGTVWANGDTSQNGARTVAVVIHEVGDKFVASVDSKNGYFKKGDTVIRQNQSIEFKSFDGFGTATEFAKSAKAFGLQLVVQMAG